MRTGRPKAALTLTPAEKDELESLARRARSAPTVAQRARMVLRCAAGEDNTTVARRLRVTASTVGKWRQRFIEHRLEGLLDEPRPGAPRKVSDAQIEDVIVRTLETTPRGATHWSTRDMARATGLSAMTISRIWRAFDLQPHRVETFKLSPDPQLIEKVRDIVGLYLTPPARAVVFSVDVKPQIQALDRTAPLLPLQPGQVERRTNDYKRHGTTSLYAALNTKTGKVIGATFSRQRAREFRRFLEQIDANVPASLDVHIILDNASAHKSAAIQRWLTRHSRFHFHFTPTYASWMNLVERWFSALTTKRLRRSAHRSVRELIATIEEFIAVHNETGKPYVWVKTADEILASIARFAQRTLDAHGTA
ncbi:IS630 family transposase [soil metagenome]